MEKYSKSNTTATHVASKDAETAASHDETAATVCPRLSSSRARAATTLTFGMTSTMVCMSSSEERADSHRWGVDILRNGGWNMKARNWNRRYRTSLSVSRRTQMLRNLTGLPWSCSMMASCSGCTSYTPTF